VTDEQQKAIEQLERRVATLETLMRRLTFVADTAERGRSVTPQPPVVHAESRATADTPAAAPVKTDLEQWFGQRGLLAIGVAALLIAVAFFLKYAFDHGWIPPLIRSIGAVVAGIVIAAWGHNRIRRGMRRYGAAMIGAGGGLAYLGLWAAAGPYALIERRLGILLLAATTVAVTMVALHHEIEGLAIWALGGAYLAPLILQTAPNPEGFLAYLEVIGLGTGILAYSMSWRATFNLALFGYLFLAAAGAAPAIAAPLGAWLVAAPALLTLQVTLRRSWPEARLGVLVIAWPILDTGLAGMTGPDATRWLSLGAATAVTGLLWWQHFQRDPFSAELSSGRDKTDVAVDRLLFIVNPMALLILAAAAHSRLIDDSYQIVPAALAMVYLPAGWFRRSASHLIAGFALLAFALPFPWPTTSVAIGWTVLAFIALAAEREAARPGGRYAAVALSSAAWAWLFSVALSDRANQAAVFTDRWALAWYVFIAGTAAAAWWWGIEGKRRVWMWILCGAAVLVGGSIEFHEYFGRMTSLAGDLALSVWWLLFAGGLVFLGFRLNQKVIRSTGLAVAAFAGSKIVLVDLANLQALYRVGSFFALALIALAVAYAYNQRAKGTQST
jgi:uncharacterized membrane protein